MFRKLEMFRQIELKSMLEDPNLNQLLVPCSNVPPKHLSPSSESLKKRQSPNKDFYSFNPWIHVLFSKHLLKHKSIFLRKHWTQIIVLYDGFQSPHGCCRLITALGQRPHHNNTFKLCSSARS
ncbi:hypothetical protein CRENBAI_000003 [Crenichthys baileyi]|uniref:Uncharacterized protein n=1 Tax=Crenichthys baileyi TaxID=28760 RepID=A0AAV9SS73_9TELE